MSPVKGMRPLQAIMEDYLTLAVYLFNLEAEKGPRYMWGAVNLSEAIDALCRISHLERAAWEGIVWPDKPITKPDKAAS